MAVKIAMVGFFSALLGALAGGALVYGLFAHRMNSIPLEAGRIQVTELTLVDGQKRPTARLRVDDDFVALEFLQMDSQKAVELKSSRNGGYESLQFGPFDGGPGQMFLGASAYGTTLLLGDEYHGPRLALGAYDGDDTPRIGGADSWGVFFEGGSFKQPDPHYPIWVRDRSHAKP